jgi:hypothetical protein
MPSMNRAYRSSANRVSVSGIHGSSIKSTASSRSNTSTSSNSNSYSYSNSTSISSTRSNSNGDTINTSAIITDHKIIQKVPLRSLR